MTEFKPMTSKIVGRCSSYQLSYEEIHDEQSPCIVTTRLMCNVSCILPHCFDSLSLSVYTVIITLLTSIESYYLVLVHFQCHGFQYFLQEDCQQCSLSVFLPRLTRIHNGELGQVEGDKATDPTQRMIHHFVIIIHCTPYLASHWLKASLQFILEISPTYRSVTKISARLHTHCMASKSNIKLCSMQSCVCPYIFFKTM